MPKIVDEEDQSRDLIEKARWGDRAAFDRLMAHLQPRLKGLIEARLGDRLQGHVEADDLVQEVTLKALQSIKRFQDQGEGSFLRWLGGIAEHLILDLADPRRRRPQVGIQGDHRASGLSPSRVMRREERFDRLQEALERLSPEHREVIRLVRIEGFSREEVARRMHRSPGAVAQLLWRALKSLKVTFGDTESLHPPQRSLERGDEHGHR